MNGIRWISRFKRLKNMYNIGDWRVQVCSLLYFSVPKNPFSAEKNCLHYFPVLLLKLLQLHTVSFFLFILLQPTYRGRNQKTFQLLHFEKQKGKMQLQRPSLAWVVKNKYWMKVESRLLVKSSPPKFTHQNTWKWFSVHRINLLAKLFVAR